MIRFNISDYEEIKKMFKDADTNDDGNIDILDIIGIINIILYDSNSCIPLIEITYNVHESLPIEWVTEFYVIMDNLTNVIPANQNYFDDLII